VVMVDSWPVSETSGKYYLICTSGPRLVLGRLKSEVFLGMSLGTVISVNLRILEMRINVTLCCAYYYPCH